MTQVDDDSYVFRSYSRRQSECLSSSKRKSFERSAVSVSNSVKFRDPKIEKNHDEFLCGYCKQQLLDPKVLPCLHSFCTGCLQEMLTQNSNRKSRTLSYNVQTRVSALNDGCTRKQSHPFASSSTSSAGSGNSGCDSERGSGSDGSWEQHLLSCPKCGCESNVPFGVSALPPNYILQHRMLIASLNQDAICLLCDLCPTEVPAISRCTDCLLNLCFLCSKAHQRFKTTAKHKTMILEVAKQHGLGITKVRRQAMCPSHPENELQLFCSPCQQVVCRDCCSLLHRGHACELSNRVVQTYTCKIKEALEKARHVNKETLASMEQFNVIAKRIQMRCLQVQSEIDKYMDAYVKALEEHRRALQLQVARAREAKLETLRMHQDELEKRTRDACHALRFGEDLLAEGSDIEILSFITPLLRRLEWCVKAGNPAPELRFLETIRFFREEMATTVNNYPVFGAVSTQTVSPAHSSLTADGLDALNDCKLQKQCEVVVITRDCDGQPVMVSHDTDTITAELRQKDGTIRNIPTQITDRQDGTYHISFVPKTLGCFWLSISIRGLPIKGSPFPVYVRNLRPHRGIYHCCTFCSSGGNKNATCGCKGRMPGGYRGCGHGHNGHPGRRHWSCCGSILHNSECARTLPGIYQFTL